MHPCVATIAATDVATATASAIATAFTPSTPSLSIAVATSLSGTAAGAASAAAAAASEPREGQRWRASANGSAENQAYVGDRVAGRRGGPADCSQGAEAHHGQVHISPVRDHVRNVSRAPQEGRH